MNWALLSRAMQAITFIAVVAFLVVAVVLNVPGALTPGLVIVTVLVLAAMAAQLLRFRAEARALARLVDAHAGEVARATAVREFPGADVRDLRRVVLLVASRDGVSFRDLQDSEVMRIPADRILSVELGPLQQRQLVRPAVVTTLDGEARFTVGITEDQQLDAIVAIRTALGRPAG